MLVEYYFRSLFQKGDWETGSMQKHTWPVGRETLACFSVLGSAAS